MEELLERCCGIDVHQASLTACIMAGYGRKINKEIQVFSTTTKGITALLDWILQREVRHVAIESTGVYWKPVFNILGDKVHLILANARHIKNVPGRKTDIKDSEWICRLLKNGLLEKNFIPPEDFRKLRDLVRYRRKRIESVAAEKNRIIKVFESANIKISSVLSDVFGVSGWKIIHAIIDGETDPDKLIRLGIRTKTPREELRDALEGRITSHHRFLLRQAVEHIKHLETNIAALEVKMKNLTDQYQLEYDLIQTIPGVSEIAAGAILAEVGLDMEQFSSEERLSSWAGMCPGSYESAGKKKGHTFSPGIIF